MSIQGIPDRFISTRELAELTGLSKVTLWRLRRSKTVPESLRLPEPVQLSPGRVGWRQSVIDAWLARRTPASGEGNGDG